MLLVSGGILRRTAARGAAAAVSHFRRGGAPWQAKPWMGLLKLHICDSPFARSKCYCCRNHFDIACQPSLQSNLAKKVTLSTYRVPQDERSLANHGEKYSSLGAAHSGSRSARIPCPGALRGGAT